MKMKKLAAVILAAAMLLCMGVSSFAEEAAQSAPIPENILKAKELADRLNNRPIAILPDGSIVVINYISDIDPAVLQTYAALDVRKIVAAPYSDIAMLTKSGELYQGMNRTAEGIADIAYCTNNVNQSGYALNVNGGISYITDGMAPNANSSDANPGDKIVAIADSERHDFFALTESGALSADVSDQYLWMESQYSAWTDLVHVAAAKYMPDSEPEAMTIVGLKADGSTVVAGDYAEEILGWGKLSWVAGSDGLIVGVREDGTLAMTGERGKAFSNDPELAKWTDIVSVDVGFECICAIDASGNYYFAHFNDYDEAPTCAVFSPDGYVRGGLKLIRYYPDGAILTTDNSTRTWVGSAD